MPSWSEYNRGRRKLADDRAYAEVSSDANMYRSALEKAAYGDAGREYGGGLDQVTAFLARSGPLADSGTKLALQKRLYSDIYGQARSRVGQGYAAYLQNALMAQRNYRYQRALMKLQKQQQSTGIGGFAGGVLGAFGGPLLGAVGSEVGSRIIK